MNPRSWSRQRASRRAASKGSSRSGRPAGPSINVTPCGLPAARARPAELAGRVTVVTGGGRGIGRQLAVALSGAGATVGLVARSPGELAETAQLITAAGGSAAAVTADLSQRKDAECALAELSRLLGPADILVNNAGIGGPVGCAWEVDPGAWWHTIEVNLGSAFLCTRLVLPGMVARGSGRIVNITSKAGVLRWPQLSAYAVSKAALIKLTENVATEAQRHGVRIFSVDPGLLPIGLGAAAVARTAPAGSAEARRDAWARRELAAGRGADPAWISQLVVRLAAGHGDKLSGRHLSVHDDLDTTLALLSGTGNGDLFQLRRCQGSPTCDVPAPAPTRTESSAAGRDRYLQGHAAHGAGSRENAEIWAVGVLTRLQPVSA
jgi:NAD(P)-dependent dehydrogenase (short-subunit alcohol dehydrogenase family)